MPTRGFNMGGRRTTGATRLRQTWFGLTVIEEQWEGRDGSVWWEKAFFKTTHELTGVPQWTGNGPAPPKDF